MYDELVKALRRLSDWSIMDFEDNLSYANQIADEAADAIEELSKDRDNWKATAKEEREAYQYWFDNYQRDVPSWIPVSERLPSEDGFTLIFTAHGHVGVCYFTNGWWGGYDKDGITHWMPLPEPPEEET